MRVTQDAGRCDGKKKTEEFRGVGERFWISF